MNTGIDPEQTSRVEYLKVAEPAVSGIPIGGDSAGRLQPEIPRRLGGGHRQDLFQRQTGESCGVAHTGVQGGRATRQPWLARLENPSVFTQHYLREAQAAGDGRPQ